jgi:hypothetical protein
MIEVMAVLGTAILAGRDTDTLRRFGDATDEPSASAAPNTTSALPAHVWLQQ